MSSSSMVLGLPKEPKSFGFFVDGKTIEIGDRQVFERFSPGHGVPVSRMPRCTPADLDMAVAAARRSFEDGRWSRIPASARARVLLEAARIMRTRFEEIAYWETLENGKPISQARYEVELCAGMFEFAAGVTRSLHGESHNNLGDALFGIVTREPIGVVGLITPWNFPFLILCERLPYILGAGCTVVAKPSEVTSATTLLMASVLQQAGLPDGVFNVVTGAGSSIGQAMTEHTDIDMVSFTGSTSVGRNCVTAAAGNFKKLALELGGKNPQIVFADADLDAAADGVAFGIGFNGGQCCIAGSRLLVERSIAAEFERMVAAKLARIRVGDPLDPNTQVGAITTDAQFRTITGYIDKGGREGARLISGGVLDLGKGQYVTPVLFGDVTPTMSVAREEIFGPVLTVTTFDSPEDAIRIANDTQYGLAASVWSSNIDKALTVARRVRAGRFWINTTLIGGPEMPIGGFKQSGWGRETGIHGIEEYTQLKSINIALGKRQNWVS